MGYDIELFDRLNIFYEEFIFIEDERKKFICDILEYEENNIPRRMINSIERLTRLADDIEKIRRGDMLKVFFLVVCIETLYSLLIEHNGVKRKKVEMIIDFFENAILLHDKNYITNNFQVILDDHIDDNNSIQTFALIINEVRNAFAHEGDLWSLTFADGDANMISVINTSIKKDGEKKDAVVELHLKYSEFRLICINGFINFVKQFFNT